MLFPDGNDAEERSNAFALVTSGKARGITTSVVALGTGSDVPALEHMSKLGDGRFYLIEDASRLPAVFAQETILAARSSINELSFKPGIATAETRHPRHRFREALRCSRGYVDHVAQGPRPSAPE